LRDPPPEFLDLFAAARGADFHRPVGPVFDITIQAKLLGLVLYKIPKADPCTRPWTTNRRASVSEGFFIAVGKILHTQAYGA
jgi:hypothetical protein